MLTPLRKEEAGEDAGHGEDSGEKASHCEDAGNDDDACDEDDARDDDDACDDDDARDDDVGHGNDAGDDAGHSDKDVDDPQNQTVVNVEAAKNSSKKRLQILSKKRSWRFKPKLETTAKPKIYGCTVCSSEFSDPSKLKRHYKNLHTDFAKIKCLHCEQLYTSNSKVNTHIKLHHPGQVLLPLKMGRPKVKKGD